MFLDDSMGELVDISGTDPRTGVPWEHQAFIPRPLPSTSPTLLPATYRAVAEARAALAALDATARQLPNPQLLRGLSLRREAQSTSALEGTYAPLDEVLTADEEATQTGELTEVLNYVTMADAGFTWIQEGRPLTLDLLQSLQGILMRGTPLEPESGRLRTTQVVIGRRDVPAPVSAPIHAARFVPSPPGDQLVGGVSDLVHWLGTDHDAEIDPVVQSAMAHYQFETLHPFRDGNGRLKRFLIVITLLTTGVLTEPTLTVSPWFEARRTEYDDALLAVSTQGDWDGFIGFFAGSLQGAADSTRDQMLALVAVQEELKDLVRSSPLRADSAISLVDLAVANLIVPQIPNGACLQLGIGGMPNAIGNLIAQSDLKDLGVHTEMYVDAFVDIAKAGKITGRHKNLDKGRQVYAFGAGTQKMYDYLDNNPECMAAPVEYTNDIRSISAIDNFISINNAVDIDLFGQVNAESAGVKHISGAGGQLDFVLGAYLSNGGKSFICLSSTFMNKKTGKLESRIRPTLENGSIVTDTRANVHYLCTEYGCVNLKGLTSWEKAEALISVAHPDFRDELIAEAEKLHIWRRSNKR